MRKIYIILQYRHIIAVKYNKITQLPKPQKHTGLIFLANNYKRHLDYFSRASFANSQCKLGRFKNKMYAKYMKALFQTNTKRDIPIFC